MSNELIVAEESADKVLAGIAPTIQIAETMIANLAFRPHDIEGSQRDYADCDRLLSELHRAYTHADEKRKEFTGPLNAVIDKINAAFRSRFEPIKFLKDRIKVAMGTFARAELDWKRNEEAKRIAAEKKKREDEQLAAAADAEKHGNHRVADAIINKPIAQPKVEVATAVDQSKSTASVQWSARVTDKMAFLRGVLDRKIDASFVSINEVELRKVAKALKSGMDWPGVEVFEDVKIGARS